MTLSPVFRSSKAVALLEQHGIWERLGPSLMRQAEAVERVHKNFAQLIDVKFRLSAEEWSARREQGPGKAAGQRSGGELAMLQDYFFLTLFLSLFEGLGVAAERLPFYADLNFTIMGTITAADNLFDDQAKSLLPLRPLAGARFASILQLMSFERLARAAGDRAVARGLFSAEEFARAQRALLDQMAEIGVLEGSEEGGVAEIPEPRAMIDAVHRVRGGKLFGLAFAAPAVLEHGETAEKLAKAEPAVARLGTAFQIVDDLTDFEFDIGRHSHNLLVSQIQHYGSAAEKARLTDLWNGCATKNLAEVKEEAQVKPREVETLFANSARTVLDFARDESRAAFATLSALGYWFPTELADEVVYAIVGLDGLARMDALTASE